MRAAVVPECRTDSHSRGRPQTWAGLEAAGRGRLLGSPPAALGRGWEAGRVGPARESLHHLRPARPPPEPRQART